MMLMDDNTPYEQTASYQIDKAIAEGREKHRFANDMEGDINLAILNNNVRNMYDRLFTDPITAALKILYKRLVDEKYNVTVAKDLKGWFSYTYKKKKLPYAFDCIKNYILFTVDTTEAEIISNELYKQINKKITNKKNQMIVLQSLYQSFLVKLIMDKINFNEYIAYIDIVNLEK